MTGLTPITFVEDVSYWIYLSGGQGDLLPGSRHKMLKNPGDPRQGERRGGWHQTPELREFTCNSGEWESNPPAAAQLPLGKGAAGALHWKPCPRGADRLPKTACACSCPKPVASEQKTTFACFTQGFGGLFPALGPLEVQISTLEPLRETTNGTPKKNFLKVLYSLPFKAEENPHKA